MPPQHDHLPGEMVAADIAIMRALEAQNEAAQAAAIQTEINANN